MGISDGKREFRTDSDAHSEMSNTPLSFPPDPQPSIIAPERSTSDGNQIQQQQPQAVHHNSGGNGNGMMVHHGRNSSMTPTNSGRGSHHSHSPSGHHHSVASHAHHTHADHLSPPTPATSSNTNSNVVAVPTNDNHMRYDDATMRSIADAYYKWLQREQILMGVVAMRDQPKREVFGLVEHIMHAGIRFVYFSQDDERKTQAFGKKIGLFTDFNTFISLRDPPRGSKQAKMAVGKSKLPCGVSALRGHIRDVDNVPLLVSLFTNSTPQTAREMLQIYQVSIISRSTFWDWLRMI
jgi:hypothetical protein